MAGFLIDVEEELIVVLAVSGDDLEIVEYLRASKGVAGVFVKLEWAAIGVVAFDDALIGSANADEGMNHARSGGLLVNRDESGVVDGDGAAVTEVVKHFGGHDDDCAMSQRCAYKRRREASENDQFSP